MFTITQVKEAHSKIKSGADFPSYIQALIKLRVKKYDTFVTNGHSQYYGAENFTIKSEATYATLIIVDNSDTDKFKNYLKIHQQGQTNYLTFCNHAAECGIEKWTVDTTTMTCVYYNKANAAIITETIPT